MHRAAGLEAGEGPRCRATPGFAAAGALRLALAFVVIWRCIRWRASGMFDLYGAVVLRSAEAASRASACSGTVSASHPKPSRTSNRRHLHRGVALVASRLPIAARLWRYGLLVLTVVTSARLLKLIDVAAAAARPSFPREGGLSRCRRSTSR
jgi:hypothetical protein